MKFQESCNHYWLNIGFALAVHIYENSYTYPQKWMHIYIDYLEAVKSHLFCREFPFLQCKWPQVPIRGNHHLSFCRIYWLLGNSYTSKLFCTVRALEMTEEKEQTRTFQLVTSILESRACCGARISLQCRAWLKKHHNHLTPVTALNAVIVFWPCSLPHTQFLYPYITTLI